MWEMLHLLCERCCIFYVRGVAPFMWEVLHLLCERCCTFYVRGVAPFIILWTDSIKPNIFCFHCFRGISPFLNYYFQICNLKNWNSMHVYKILMFLNYTELLLINFDKLLNTPTIMLLFVFPVSVKCHFNQIKT
jgi:hypothetical protein